jgi:poly-gamma-glutamate synthesis protein (capsule biosynthesis protein)
MLASEKVDEFYAFLKSKRYSDHDPDTVIIISPNHFNPRSITPQTICESREVYFKQQSFFLTPFPNISCEENIFYPFGSTIITNEHGIGEQLPRIAKYFSEVKQIIPLILPSHREPTMSSLRGEAETSVPFIRSDDTLIIASVDFSHYLPEAIAQSNDKTSITVLQS